MPLVRTILHEAFLPAFTLLVALTVGELFEPGFASGAVNLPLVTVVVILLGVVVRWSRKSEPDEL